MRAGMAGGPHLWMMTLRRVADTDVDMRVPAMTGQWIHTLFLHSNVLSARAQFSARTGQSGQT